MSTESVVGALCWPKLLLQGIQSPRQVMILCRSEDNYPIWQPSLLQPLYNCNLRINPLRQFDRQEYHNTHLPEVSTSKSLQIWLWSRIIPRQRPLLTFFFLSETFPWNAGNLPSRPSYRARFANHEYIPQSFLISLDLSVSYMTLASLNKTSEAYLSISD